MPGMTKGIREQQKKRKELLSKTKTKTKTKPKSKAEIAKAQVEANRARKKRANIKSSVDRPKQKQKPKSQLKKKIKKGFEDFKTGFKKGLKNPITAPLKIIKDKITSGGSKAKADTIKRKDKPKKETSREYVTRHAGVTSKMPKGKDSQIMKAERDRRARAKAKAAKKKERDNRADVRDAKRGGFISANAMKSSAKKANKAQADRKKKKSDELISRGRK